MSCSSLLPGLGCREPARVTIAVIPRTTASMQWEPMHRGAEAAAADLGVRIYWNAPMREDDVGGQIAMVGRVIGENYQGLVLAPDQALALITPVRRATSRKLPTVIVGSPLPMEPGGRLSYILNDEEEGGRIAARRVATLLHGHGSIAILGINPDIAGIMTRARSLEQFLAENYPDIRVVQKLMGSFNMPREQQIAEQTLQSNPDLDAIVALMWTSARGAISAVDAQPHSRIKVIGFDPDVIAFQDPALDSVILQNNPEIGRRAVQLIDAQLHGKTVPPLTTLKPLLVTRENADSPQVREMTSMDWRPGALHWNWSTTP
ncbi:MAG TPA: substrate-binding domain-containing protein [Acidisarcina sp.]|nr:substrate-binding domain-containing protein [Acidisarcina sp.]